MKNIHKYIMLFVMAFAVASCADDEIIENNNSGKPSGDVQFGLSLDNGSRTVYGEEAGNAFPIYWVNGDKVQIFSPQCLEGRRSAEYEVILPTELPEGKLGPDYAEKLKKIGDYGVQWGNTETADFYSLYPSGQYDLSNDGSIAKNIQINYSQNIVVDDSGVKSDMEDCLMYANALGVENGKKVDLQYNPISTVFWVTLNVSSTSAEDFMIQSVSLVAPESTNIAGTFNLAIANGQFAGWVKGSNSVMAQIVDKNTNEFYTLAKGESLSLPLFLAPVTGLNTKDWKIKVVANSKEYVKTLGEQDIVAGQIHKVTLPNLSVASVEEWDVATWMKYIPRNVYLSEVSIPGTWNSLNPDFQTSLSIAAQYEKGVRAFHLDTRWQREYAGVSWSGIEYNYTLGVANGGSTQGGSTDKYDNDSPLFKDCLEQILGNIKSDEYMVLICSFAQNSADVSGTNGKWYSEISAICNEYTDVYDAKNLTPNTVVGDVLGKVIVIVNMPSAISATTVLPTNSKCLFTYLPSELSKSHFDGTDDNQDDLWVYASASSSKDSGINIYNNQAQITSNTTDGISTSKRGYAPTVSERNTVLNKILDWSKKNYANTDNYAHDQWIYLGLGGYQVNDANANAVSGSYVAIETQYNSWINDSVEAMGNNGVSYYPVGIVLMNNKNGTTNYTDKTNAAGESYNFDAVVKNILLLNNRYRLQFDPNKPTNYDPNYKEPDDFDGGFENGGNEGDEEDPFA